MQKLRPNIPISTPKHTGKMPHISKVLYYISLFVWGLNIICAVGELFINVPGIWIIVVFIAVLIEGVCSGAFGDESIFPDSLGHKRFLDYCLIVSAVISIGCSVLCGGALLLVGGGPEIVDGTYCIVSHGEIVRTLFSPGWYLFFVVCDKLWFGCGILIFSSIMALRIRTLFRTQKQK